MTLVRWSPSRDRGYWNSLSGFQNRMNSLFDEFFSSDDESANVQWAPRVDVVDLDDKYEFAFELPGMKKEDVKIQVRDNAITISGEKVSEHEKKDRSIHLSERRFGCFSRTFQLPANVKAEEIEATFKDGILKVQLPKAEEEKPKQIDIKAE